MKTRSLRPLLFALSSAGNLALLAVMFTGAIAPHEPTPAPDRAARPPAMAPKPAVAAPLDPAIWRAFDTMDLPALVARLRAEGFPPEFVQALMAALVHESFAARRKAIEEAERAIPFWRTTPYAFFQSKPRRDLGREERALLQSLLGTDATESAELTSLRRQFPNLSPEKLAAVERLYNEHAERTSELILPNDYGTPPLPDHGGKRAALEREFQARLLGVLTPEEREAFNLRMSDTADTMRDDLSAFAPTEEEFRAIFRLRQAFDQRFGDMWWPGLTPDESRVRNVAEEQMDKDIRAALGEARYADYQRANDYDYQKLTQLTTRLGQPIEVARDLFSLREDLERRASQVIANRTIPDERQRQQLAALEAEARAQIAARLGPQGLEAYMLNATGSWIARLTPQPPRR